MPPAKASAQQASAQRVSASARQVSAQPTTAATRPRHFTKSTKVQERSMSPALKTIPTRHRRELPRRHAAPGSRIRQQIVAFSCTSGSPLVTIKGGSQGRFRRTDGGTNGQKEKGSKTNTSIERDTPTLLENNVSSSPHHPRRDLGQSPLSHLACNPLLQALRCKEYKIDLSDWT